MLGKVYFYIIVIFVSCVYQCVLLLERSDRTLNHVVHTDILLISSQLFLSP